TEPLLERREVFVGEVVSSPRTDGLKSRVIRPEKLAQQARCGTQLRSYFCGVHCPVPPRLLPGMEQFSCSVVQQYRLRSSNRAGHRTHLVRCTTARQPASKTYHGEPGVDRSGPETIPGQGPGPWSSIHEPRAPVRPSDLFLAVRADPLGTGVG